MKLWAYAIAKNEGHNVQGLINSVFCEGGADGLLVLDTGSTDDTVSLLRADPRVVVHEAEIKPWRFDVARNTSLSLVPGDVDWVAVMDMDWRPEPGWGNKIKEVVAANPKATRLGYTYVFDHRDDGSNGTLLALAWTHKRHGFLWKGVIHENPYGVSDEEDLLVDCPGYIVHHYCSPTDNRAQYLPRLIQACEEEPTNPRPHFYLGRQYLLEGDPKSAVPVLEKYLSLNPTFLAEKAEAMRLIALCQTDLTYRRMWLLRACSTYFCRRDHWVDLALVAQSLSDPALALAAIQAALTIVDRTGGGFYSDKVYWGELPYVVAAHAAWMLGAKDIAIQYIQRAEQLAPDNEDIKKSRQRYKKDSPSDVAIVTYNACYGGVESIVADHAAAFGADVFVASGARNDGHPFPNGYTYLIPPTPEVNYVWPFPGYKVAMYHSIPDWCKRALTAAMPTVEVIHGIESCSDREGLSLPTVLVTTGQFIANYIKAVSGRTALVVPQTIRDIPSEPPSERGKFVGGIARYSPEKRLDWFVKAWKEIEDDVPEAHARLYAEGCATGLAGYGCQRLDLLGAVWPVSDYWKEFRLFVLTSTFEGVPLVMLEALAHNVPVLAPDLPGVLEFARIARNRGYSDLITTFPVNDFEALVKILRIVVKEDKPCLRGHEYISTYCRYEDGIEGYRKAWMKAISDYSKI
jgi:glycosyltransferase involved in cell wall biosynthesis